LVLIISLSTNLRKDDSNGQLTNLPGVDTRISLTRSTLGLSAHPRNPRRITTIKFTEEGERKRDWSIREFVSEFAITSEQCGRNDYIAMEYAKVMAKRSLERQEGVQEIDMENIGLYLRITMSDEARNPKPTSLISTTKARLLVSSKDTLGHTPAIKLAPFVDVTSTVGLILCH
jgi:hypothetical protein